MGSWAAPTGMKMYLSGLQYSVQLLSPQFTKRHGQTGEHPKAGHEDDQRAGEPPL